MISLEQVQTVGTFYHRTARNADGSALRCRANGRCKLWKRRPDRFRLPVKHGLRDCFYLTPDNAADWFVLDPTAVARELGLAPDTPPSVLANRLEDLGRYDEARALR